MASFVLRDKKNEWIENFKKMKTLEDIKDFIFHCKCLVGNRKVEG